MQFNTDVVEVAEAKKWWEQLPDGMKGKCSIYVILAMYATHVLRTRTVAFDADRKR